MINIGEVVRFIDNIVVEIEEEKIYDEVVEEVVKIVAENDLYVKLERYEWKVRKVRFLRVVIRLEKNKMEEEKVKEVLDWPTSKRVKCYDSRLKVLSQETTLVLSNIRELDRVPNTK